MCIRVVDLQCVGTVARTICAVRGPDGEAVAAKGCRRTGECVVAGAGQTQTRGQSAAEKAERDRASMTAAGRKSLTGYVANTASCQSRAGWRDYNRSVRSNGDVSGGSDAAHPV